MRASTSSLRRCSNRRAPNRPEPILDSAGQRLARRRATSGEYAAVTLSLHPSRGIDEARERTPGRARADRARLRRGLGPAAKTARPATSRPIQRRDRRQNASGASAAAFQRRSREVPPSLRRTLSNAASAKATSAAGDSHEREPAARPIVISTATRSVSARSAELGSGATGAQRDWPRRIAAEIEGAGPAQLRAGRPTQDDSQARPSQHQRLAPSNERPR